MNRQEIFDKVATHLLKQNRKCEDSDEACCYRNKGMKCAIGALIPDEIYDPVIERKRIVDILDRDGCGAGDDSQLYNKVCKSISDFLGITSKEDHYFLFQLQRIHDHTKPGRWEYKLRHLAGLYDLKYGEDVCLNSK